MILPTPFEICVVLERRIERAALDRHRSAAARCYHHPRFKKIASPFEKVYLEDDGVFLPAFRHQKGASAYCIAKKLNWFLPNLSLRPLRAISAAKG